MLIDRRPINVAHHQLLSIDRAFGDDLAVRTAQEALAPEFDAVTPGGCLASYPIGHRHIATIRDRMTPLNCFQAECCAFPNSAFSPGCQPMAVG